MTSGVLPVVLIGWATADEPPRCAGADVVHPKHTSACWGGGVSVGYGDCLPSGIAESDVPQELRLLATRSVLITWAPRLESAAPPGVPRSRMAVERDHNLCKGQAYAGGRYYGDCSGVVWGNGYVVTAAHCTFFRGRPLQAEEILVYEWDSLDPLCNVGRGGFAPECVGDVHAVSAIEARGTPSDAGVLRADDIAVLRVQDFEAEPELGSDGPGVWVDPDSPDGSKIAAIGFPLGAGLQVSPPALVTGDREDAGLYAARVSVVGGFSGAPVWVLEDAIYRRWTLLGVLIGGAADFVTDGECACHRDASAYDSEGIIPVSEVRGYIP